MSPAEIKQIIGTLGIEEKTATSLTHPPLAMGSYCMNAAKIVEFVEKIEIAVLAKVILEQSQC